VELQVQLEYKEKQVLKVQLAYLEMLVLLEILEHQDLQEPPDL
jgi:hypothetical protein